MIILKKGNGLQDDTYRPRHAPHMSWLGDKLRGVAPDFSADFVRMISLIGQTFRTSWQCKVIQIVGLEQSEVLPWHLCLSSPPPHLPSSPLSFGA
jgi:hypothetical protein